MVNNSMRWVWKCLFCDDFSVSYSHQIHTMDICKCGRSGVDLEEGYARGMGSYETVDIKKFINKKWVKIKDK